MSAYPESTRVVVRRLAHTRIRHRRITFLAWVAILFAAVAGASAAGSEYSTNFQLPESDSQRAFELLDARILPEVRIESEEEGLSPSESAEPELELERSIS